MINDTIAAIVTAPGNGPVGIVRLSGPQALEILGRLWSKIPEVPESHRMYYAKIAGDTVLTFWQQAPASYTGEDVVEIQGHGGRKVLETLLEAVLKAGARPAAPGEFTQRAFLNGRMDLAQAEAVADLINANSRRAVVLAERQLEGRLSEYVSKLRNELKVMRAQMEAMIDFPEDEDVQGLRYDEITDRIARVDTRLRALIQTYEEGRYLKDGIRVAIVGKPNAGKSSLFNALVGDDRAIVHATPGTTRDTIEEVLDLNGLTMRFIDTAGIRTGEDTIEAEGIRRSELKIAQADLILFVLDGSRPWEADDDRIQNLVRNQKTKVLHLLNKSDVSPALHPDFSVLKISAKNGTGLEELKSAMAALFLKETPESSVVLTNLRHRVALEKGLEALEKVQGSAREARSLEFLVSDLTLAMNHLGEVTGEITNDEILGEIFTKFCIGK